jgi:hypothetical protein
MSIFVNVIAKGDGLTYRKEFIHYIADGGIHASNGCPIIGDYVGKTLDNIKSDEEIDTITIKLEFDW